MACTAARPLRVAVAAASPLSFTYGTSASVAVVEVAGEQVPAVVVLGVVVAASPACVVAAGT